MVLKEENNKINKNIYIYIHLLYVYVYTHKYLNIFKDCVDVYFSCGSMITLPCSALSRQADLEKYAESMLQNLRYLKPGKSTVYLINSK